MTDKTELTDVEKIYVPFIEYFEGFRAEVYEDVGGTPTIGYGTTASAGVVDPLPETCTQAEAQRWLIEYIERYVAPAVTQAREAGLLHPFNNNQAAALYSLGYNLGSGIFQDDHTIGYDIRHGATLARIASDFLLYEYDGTMKLAGLVTRREAEKALFERKV